MKTNKPLQEIAPLEFSDLRVKLEYGGVALCNFDGELFIDADDARALHEWLTRALTKPVCERHEWFALTNGKRRCKSCRMDKLSEEPIEGRWYVVKVGDCTFPAKRVFSAAGGWTNEDTWEDFNSEVTEYVLMTVQPVNS